VTKYNANTEICHFPFLQTPTSGFPGVEDDLVFSGAGSGCNADDEDECTPLFESGSGKYVQCIPHVI
jgi:hypothetical protein